MFVVVLLVLTLSPKDAAIDPLAAATVTGSADPFQSYPAPPVRCRAARPCAAGAPLFPADPSPKTLTPPPPP